MSRRIAALLTCFNRKDKTVNCIERLFLQTLPTDIELVLFVTDDASADGTANAIRKQFPQVHLLAGDGSLYWDGGMRVAFAAALEEDFDFYLWINDDTMLESDAIRVLLESHSTLLERTGRDPIVVGSIRDPQSGVLTYGGQVRSSFWHPMKMRRVDPASVPQQCDTMNGNCVLIPRAVARIVGNISSEFTQSMGDSDYGLRAQKAGFQVWTAPGWLGTCCRNPVRGTWQDPLVPLTKRWKLICGPKGLPPREWRTYTSRHAGVFWPLFWCMPYIRVFLLSFKRASISG